MTTATSIGRAIFAAKIADKIGVDKQALQAEARKVTLAPLEPNAFLRWAWQQGDRAKGTSPLTVDDIAFELGEQWTREEVRRQYVHLAALVRRNMRLGVDPWEGVR